MTSENQAKEVKASNAEIKKAASVLQELVNNRFLTVELQSGFDNDLNKVTSAQFKISSPPKRGKNSQSVAIRFCPITSYPLILFDVSDENGSVIVTAKK